MEKKCLVKSLYAVTQAVKHTVIEADFVYVTV